MIIYATEFYVYREPIENLLEGVLTWLKSKDFYGPLNYEFLLETCKSTRYGTQEIEIFADYENNQYIAWAMRFMHGDKKTPGRRWNVEIGICCEGDFLHGTILVHTTALNLQISSPGITSRPRLINDVLYYTRPHESTAGLYVYTIEYDSLLAVRNIIEDHERHYPMVIVSPLDDGSYVVPPDLLRSHMVSLADVYVIPPYLPFEERDRVLGPQYNAWDGAIKIIWPYAQNAQAWEQAKVNWFLAEELQLIPSLVDRALRVLTMIVNRSNFRLSNRHLSIERLREQHLQRELARFPAEKEFLQNLLDDTTNTLIWHQRERKILEEQIEGERDRISELERQVYCLQEENRNLKMLLEQASYSKSDSSLNNDFKAAIQTLILNQQRISLSEALMIITSLFPERVVILDSAWRSARDAAKFERGHLALQLLFKLATDYWVLLCNGGNDGQALRIFGTDNFAAKESKTTQKNTNARQLRTFLYKGQEIEMHAHLRIGVKESLAQTWRAHFHWDAEEQRIVIGHCGRHLNFG